MILHAKDSPALRRQVIDANGQRRPELIEWVNLDTGEACRFRTNALGEILLGTNYGPIREIIQIPAPVSVLPMD